VTDYGSFVVQINDTTGAMTTYDAGRGSYGIAFDSHTNSIWVTSADDDSITQFVPSR
jgi:DNA-binding beta-propeller fold protein YncE